MLSFLASKLQRNSTRKNLTAYDKMYDVTDVVKGYDYWIDMLKLKIVRMFDVQNLPDTIPVQEIEKLTLFEGKAGFINDPVYGYLAVPCSLYGIGLYPNYPPFMLWATPRVEGDGIINRDCCVIRNNTELTSVMPIIKRYARMLADTESTLENALYNVRQPAVASAPNEQIAASYKAVNLAMRLGQTDAVIDDDILKDIQMLPAIHTIPANLLETVVNTRQELIRAFFAEFGVQMSRDKKAPMTTDEVAADNQQLVISVEDMLASRVESYSSVNRTFGLNIKVDLSDKFKPIGSARPIAFNNIPNGDNVGRGAE
jgi:hypothetical protein